MIHTGPDTCGGAGGTHIPHTEPVKSAIPSMTSMRLKAPLGSSTSVLGERLSRQSHGQAAANHHFVLSVVEDGMFEFSKVRFNVVFNNVQTLSSPSLLLAPELVCNMQCVTTAADTPDALRQT